MSDKSVPPQLGAKSFSCPHCGALADQTWFEISVDERRRDSPPWMPTEEDVENFRTGPPEVGKAETVRFFERWLSGEVFIEKQPKSAWLDEKVMNLHVSKCFSCNGVTIWIADRLLYPAQSYVVQPADDMPPDVQQDFAEAASIVDASPRGAAALLRLCVQKLTKRLGCEGKNINEDIGKLVKGGLNPKVQMALDVVRVVGNNAVHPGQIDVDDKATAIRLFNLVNLIVEAMISAPKHVEAMFDSLPESALKAIEKRDGPKLLQPPGGGTGTP